jgi:hypothetical protein
MNEATIDTVFKSMYTLLTDLSEMDGFRGYFELEMMNRDTPMLLLMKREFETHFGWDEDTSTDMAFTMHRDLLMHTNAYTISRVKTSKTELYNFIYNRMLEQRRGLLSTIKNA